MYKTWFTIICAGVINSTQHSACLKSFEAFGAQTGFTEKTKNIERKTTLLLEKQSDIIDQNIKFLFATAYSIGIKKELILTTRIPEPFQNLEIQGHTNRAVVLLKWNF